MGVSVRACWGAGHRGGMGWEYRERLPFKGIVITGTNAHAWVTGSLLTSMPFHCSTDPEAKDANTLVLTEGSVLGGGAFSRVSIVNGEYSKRLTSLPPVAPSLSTSACLHPAEDSTGRVYALKRMRKSAVVQCPEHVYCEQAITKNVAHPFCIRQYASFQVHGGTSC